VTASRWTLVGLFTALAGLGAIAGLVRVGAVPDAILTLIAVLALLPALGVAADRYQHRHQQADPPAPERRATVTAPDAEFDLLLSGGSLGTVVGPGDRAAVRERLETDAVAVLTRYEGLSEQRARDRLADGSWTDDPYAAAFFGAGDPTVPLRERVRAALRDESRFQRRARHAVHELSRRVDQRVASGHGKADREADTERESTRTVAGPNREESP
jgi:hypothetical protein